MKSMIKLQRAYDEAIFYIEQKKRETSEIVNNVVNE